MMEIYNRDTVDRSRMAKYCKYLDLVPNWLIEQCGREEILSNWPLRHISKKPKIQPQFPVIQWSKSHREMLNDNRASFHHQYHHQSHPHANSRHHGSTVVLDSASISAKLQRSPRILNEFNSNTLINSLVLSNSRKVINAPVYVNHNINNNNVSNYNNNNNNNNNNSASLPTPNAYRLQQQQQQYQQQLQHQHQYQHQQQHLQQNHTPGHIPTFGQIVNNRLYSVPLYPNQRIQTGKACWVTSSEHQERVKREMKRYIHHCIMELGFSSPLTSKLYKVLSISQSSLHSDLFISSYERFCSTNLRYPSLKTTSSGSCTASGNSFFKPSRTLRSNTIIDDRPSSNSDSDIHIHRYCFTKRQRYQRWSRIEDNMGLSWRRRRKLRKPDLGYEIIRTFESDSREEVLSHHPHCKSESIPLETKAPINFPLVNFNSKMGNDINIRREYCSSSSVQANRFHDSMSTPLSSLQSSSMQESKTYYKVNSPLSSDCGYEIIFEPLSNTSARENPGQIPIEVKDESQLDTIINKTSKSIGDHSSLSSNGLNNNDVLISEDIVIRRLKPVPSVRKSANDCNRFPSVKSEDLHKPTSGIGTRSRSLHQPKIENEDMRIVRVPSRRTEWKKEPIAEENDVMLIKVIPSRQTS
ncbi:uncharacterized protein LOC141852974 [Brevipalpus obovatus]|uniref:uncharacterized protein LOC141852974 n=1 Tax=Brevipalpus obovatus TaxID=246614 RepID=UPI003D9FB049